MSWSSSSDSAATPTESFCRHRAFRPGDRVTFAQGPFANFVATIESLAPDRRVWVLLDLMGQQARVAVQTDQIRAT
jgi:transcriptional antiterminator RfaH